MSWTKDDPRSESERALADLKRNTEMAGEAPSLSPIDNRPSVTPATFGETDARTRRAEEEATPGGTGDAPGSDNAPGQGGFYHADTRMGTSHSESIADFEKTITGAPDAPDAMTRAKE